jgi:hypothetical protein
VHVARRYMKALLVFARTCDVRRSSRRLQLSPRRPSRRASDEGVISRLSRACGWGELYGGGREKLCRCVSARDGA